MKYILRELQNINSFREGEEIEAANLTAAKAMASRKQLFQGTILTLTVGGTTALDDTTGEVVCYKDAEGWHNED